MLRQPVKNRLSKLYFLDVRYEWPSVRLTVSAVRRGHRAETELDLQAEACEISKELYSFMLRSLPKLLYHRDRLFIYNWIHPDSAQNVYSCYIQKFIIYMLWLKPKARASPRIDWLMCGIIHNFFIKMLNIITLTNQS